MQFHVPQFINVEDKIFGPLSFKQFVYLVGGAGFCVILYAVIPYKVIAYPFIIVAAGFSLALTFYRVNDKPFIEIVQAAFSYITKSRLYLWQHREHKDKTQKQVESEAKEIEKVLANMSRNASNRKDLSSTSFAVDVGSNSEQGTEKETFHTSSNRSPS
jgi:hypothetical protein